MGSSTFKSIGLAVAIVILLAPSTILADVLVLKSGEQISGRFANRELLRRDPFALKHVTIDVGADAPEMRIVQFDQVDYLVFEGPGGERDVVDVWGAQDGTMGVTAPAVGDDASYTLFTERPGTPGARSGFIVAALGLAAITVGALVPFGEETVLGENTVGTEDERNTANWVTMGAGALVFFLGMYQIGNADNAAADGRPAVRTRTAQPVRRYDPWVTGTIMAFGAAAIGVGAVHKFGSKYGDDTYNGVNYMLLGGGALALLAGAYTIVSNDDDPHPVFGRNFAGETTVGVALNF